MTRLMTSIASAAKLLFSLPASVIRNGTSENNRMLSKQKMSATGAVASDPSVARAKPGPI
jgi:hypothetical protein